MRLKLPFRIPKPSAALVARIALLLALPCAARCHAINWFPVGPDGGDARSFGSDPSDHNHLYLGTETGWIYESRDGGASWSHLARLGKRDDLVIDNILVDRADPKHILAGAYDVAHPDGGLFNSRDGGQTWTANADMAGQSVRSLAQAPSDPAIVIAGSLDGVYRSADGGEHWSAISPAGSKEIHEVESLAIDPKDPQAIYAGTWHLPWKTTDGGESWHNIKEGVIDDSDVFSIIVDPASPETVYASACSGIYKSENAGELFRKVQGIPATSRRTRVLLQDPKNAQVVFAGTTEGLYRTGDGGATWAALTDRDVIVNDIRIDPDDSDRMLVATDRAGVLASKDGGSSFEQSNRGFSAQQVTSVLADSKNPAVLYAGLVNDKQWGGVFQSKDGGISWAQLSDGLEGHDVFALAQAQDGGVLAGTNGGVFKRRDEGWAQSGALAAESDAATPPDAQHPSGGARRTPSAGKQRQRKAAAPAKKKQPEPAKQIDGAVFAIAAGAEQVYAATSEGLVRSADSGATWSKLALPMDASAVTDWRSVAAIGHAVFAADSSRLIVSYDDGANWKLPSLPPQLTGVVAIALDASGGLWVAGREGLFASADQGDSWTGVPDFNLNNILGIFYETASNAMLVTAGTTMAYTIDLASRQVKVSESGWSLRFARPVGDHLLGATLFDGLVLQPRMVVSPFAPPRDAK